MGLEIALVLARLGQFAAAMVVCGSAAFFVYGLRPDARAAWPGRLLAGAAALGGVSTFGWLMAQAGALGDGPSSAFDLRTVWSVAADTGFGRVAAGRLLLFLVALPLARLRAWRALAVIGGFATASFAWTGHAAAEEGAAGAIHIAADLVHLLSAALWLGALPPLTMLVVRCAPTADETTLEAARAGLAGFSGVGPLVVAALAGSGVANSLFLVSPDQLVRSAYGAVLLAKLVLFALMLGLAAANRYVLTPALSRTRDASPAAGAGVAALRASLIAETGLGVAVLGCVAWLGTLSPA